jgi:rhodanese-related sulfurtransferase
MALSSSPDYAGDISAVEAWDKLKADPGAQLVDVRTVAEWNFVGLPDLSYLGRQVHCV